MSSTVAIAGTAGSLAGQACALLEEQLVTLAIEPGTLLQEKALVATLGIGRTPVREAVQKLSSWGILRVMPRKGLVVAPVLRSELQQIIEARRVLERLLVVKAAERATAGDRQALRSLAEGLEESASDVSRFFRLDRQLDELLNAACANQYIVRALEPMHAHCRRFWYLVRDRVDLEASSGMHAMLARSVADADGSGAIRALNGIISVLEEQLGGLDAIS